MKVSQLMTRDVVSVEPETSLKEVAETLVRNRITGVPVCDASGTVVGVVSEADILYKERSSHERHGVAGWLAGGQLPAEAAKTTARTAGQSMTSPALTTSPSETVERAARLMTTRNVNRLPVLEGERLVGIVTRADLVRAFIRSDTDIEHEIRDDVIRATLWIDPALVGVEVAGGAVRLSGTVPTTTDARLIERFVASVPGVVSVQSSLAAED